MKTKKTVTVLITLVMGFAFGLIIGLTLNDPGLSIMEVTGTIGRVDKYRNVRITEADVELKNDLISNEAMREAYLNYLAFEYASNVELGNDVRFALQSSYKASDFKSFNIRTIRQMEDYAEFLDNTRINILEAIGTINDISSNSRVAVCAVLNNAGNALAQTIYRSPVLFDYMSAVERYYNNQPRSSFPDLVKAHDRLFTSLLIINIVNENRPALEHLLARNLMEPTETISNISAENLHQIIDQDASKLRNKARAESLQEVFKKAEKEGITAIFDREKLGAIFDSERLTFQQDSEQLRGPVFDSEKLHVSLDSERLMLDSERLKTMFDSERLNIIFISEQMGLGPQDVHKLDALLNSAEQLKHIGSR